MSYWKPPAPGPATIAASLPVFNQPSDQFLPVDVSFVPGGNGASGVYAIGNAFGPTGSGLAPQTLDLTAAFGSSLANRWVTFVHATGIITASAVTTSGTLTNILGPNALNATYTDGSAATPNATDAQNIAQGALPQFNFSMQAGNLLAGTSWTFANSNIGTVKLDGNGRLYLLLYWTAACNYTTMAHFWARYLFQIK